MTERIEAELAILRQQAADLESGRARCERMIAEFNLQLAELRGRIAGLEQARDMMGDRPEAAAKPRHHVKGPVLAALWPLADNDGLTEDALVKTTNLPGGSVHKFLLAGVRDGRLACDRGRYRINRPKPSAAA